MSSETELLGLPVKERIDILSVKRTADWKVLGVTLEEVRVAKNHKDFGCASFDEFRKMLSKKVGIDKSCSHRYRTSYVKCIEFKDKLSKLNILLPDIMSLDSRVSAEGIEVLGKIYEYIDANEFASLLCKYIDGSLKLAAIKDTWKAIRNGIGALDPAIYSKAMNDLHVFGSYEKIIATKSQVKIDGIHCDRVYLLKNTDSTLRVVSFHSDVKGDIPAGVHFAWSIISNESNLVLNSSYGYILNSDGSLSLLLEPRECTPNDSDIVRVLQMIL